MSRTQLYIYDLTIKSSLNTSAAIIAAFTKLCKKWIFQEEVGEATAYAHYQCRINLKAKVRLTTLATQLSDLDITGVHISRTSNSGKSAWSYVMKEHTRSAGPWKDSDITLPPHLAIVDINQLPWEKQVEELPYDLRLVHFICDSAGLQGKSTWSLYRHIRHAAIYVTAWDEPIQVFQAIYAATVAKQPFSKHEIIIDLPRTRLSDTRLYQLWTILEGIKNGYIQEYRYQHRQTYLGPTRLIVFSNYRLDPGHSLTRDRAKHYNLTNNTLFGASL